MFSLLTLNISLQQAIISTNIFLHTYESLVRPSVRFVNSLYGTLYKTCPKQIAPKFSHQFAMSKYYYFYREIWKITIFSIGQLFRMGHYMGNGRKSGLIQQCTFNSLQTWIKVHRCAKFHQNMSRIAALNTKLHGQASDGGTDGLRIIFRVDLYNKRWIDLKPFKPCARFLTSSLRFSGR